MMPKYVAELGAEFGSVRTSYEDCINISILFVCLKPSLNYWINDKVIDSTPPLIVPISELG